MKKLALALILSVVGTSTFSAGKKTEGVRYDYAVTRVVDGDTVTFRAVFLPDPLKKELALRIYGVDTPEKGSRAKCAAEDKKGKEATEFTQRVVDKAVDHSIVIQSWDKYGGRVLGDVLLDGKSLREMLIKNGYAREYYGEAKQSWCKK